ncbi:MAG: imelysin family protein [Gammaproteobacteria bacterium]
MNTIPIKRLFIYLCFGLLLACDADNPAPDASAPPASDSAETTLRLDPEQAALTTEITNAYLRQVDADFNTVDAELESLAGAVSDLLASPDAASLQEARSAWISANTAYELTSVHRFFADTIASDADSLAFFQLQYQINHWPILPGYIDYVVNYPDSGIVNDMTVAIEPDSLRAQHGAFDADEAAIGFQVVEFLLWGENVNDSPARPASDFLPQTELSAEEEADGMSVSDLPNNRRRELLRNTVAILRSDFAELNSLWLTLRTGYATQLNDRPARDTLTDLLDAITRLLTEQILAGSLYQMLNGEFQASKPSIYSNSSATAASAALTGLERLLLETSAPDAANLDSLLNSLSDNYEEFFLPNFDSSKECLVVLFSTDPQEFAAAPAVSEFKVVECINSITNMIDYLERLKAGDA